MVALSTGGPRRRAMLVSIAAALVLSALAAALFLNGLTGGGLLAAGLVAIPGVSWVVTARRARRSEEQRDLAQLLDSIPRPLFVVEAWRAGPNTCVNREYCAFTGYDAGEAVSPGFDALGVFADPADAAALAGRIAAGVNRQVTVRRRDGSTVAARLEVRALHGAGGPRGFVGILEPVESHRQDDPRPPAQAGGLATMPPGGGASDAFLSWLTHELRSPLNACVMWLDVLALSPQPEKLTKAVEAIKRNLARQSKLVSDLSDAARVSGNGLEVRLGPLDLVALLERSIDAWQMAAIGRQITFQHRIAPGAARLQGDSERLVQALSHLVDNAMSSTPSGGRLELRTRHADDAYVVEIEDTGGVLSAEDSAHLFEPLWRSPASAKSRSGLGLGLAVAHHIVEKHRGTLTVSNGLSGAVFTLTFPLATPADLEALEPAARTTAV